MALNHINLVTSDVAKSRELFETYFGFRCVVDRGRDAFAVLVDASGFILTLSNLDKVTSVEYPGIFHIGFMQDSRERVDEIYQRLKTDGFLTPSRRRSFTGRGRFISEPRADSRSRSGTSIGWVSFH